MTRWIRTSSCLLLAALSGCGGLGHRSTDQVGGTVEIGPGIKQLRIIVENGTLELTEPDDAIGAGKVSYKGGVRRAADTAEDLAKIEALSTELRGVPDPEDPTTLVIRGPHVPEGVVGLIAFEANFRAPQDMPVELIVRENGHIVVDHRTAPTKVSTGRGDLRLQHCSAAVEARSGGGYVIVNAHRGDLDVRTLRGDMQVRVLEAGKSLTLDSGKGTIQCHVPADLEFDCDARVERGRIGNDFGLEVRQIGEFGAAMTGRRGSASTSVLMRTASGHLQLIAHKSD